MLGQPGNRDRGVEPARIGQDDACHVALEPTAYVASRLTSAAARAGVARDHENRVVAGDRADRFRQLRAIERVGQRLRLAAARADDDELLDALDAAQELGGRALERGERRLRVRRLGAGPLVGAVAGALDEAELLDVARNRRLRRVEAALAQAAAQLLLAVERLAVDQFEDDGLAARFHERRIA